MVTPKSAVIDNEQILKLKKIPAAIDIAAIVHAPLKIYENVGVSGMSKLEVENNICDDVSIEYFLNKMDFLWMYGRWKTVLDVPGIRMKHFYRISHKRKKHCLHLVSYFCHFFII